MLLNSRFVYCVCRNIDKLESRWEVRKRRKDGRWIQGFTGKRVSQAMMTKD